MTDTDNTHNDIPPQEPTKRKRHHVIRSPWLRIPLKLLVALIFIIIAIPVLIYLPPVQSFLKDIACDVVRDQTGMKVSIGTFRLGFPLDVVLDDVTVVEATGDTMVRARSLRADVKLKPLFDKNIRLNGLRLTDGYYRMVAADSSMIMTVDAGLLDVDSRSSFALGTMSLDLNKARLRDGDIKLYMDVWKKKPTPPDSVQPSTPFKIKANDLRLENMNFAMSMLPTIDTLTLRADRLALRDATIDLGTNNIHAALLTADKGTFAYLAPTAEYVRTHPAPIDTISPPSPPMTIDADSIALNDFDVLYGIAGAKPQPGFDANYVSLTGLNVSLKDFYNQQSTVRAPITRLMGRERCGLQILSGSGLFTIDSIGLTLQDIDLRTPNTTLLASASVPFALMQLKPNAPMSVEAKGKVGFADLTAFMPSLSEYTGMLRPANSLLLTLDAAGTLALLKVGRLEAELPQIFALKGRGNVDNPLTPEKMRGNVDFVASLTAPEVVQRAAGIKDVNIPRFTIDGTASIDGQTYAADFTMRSSAGDVSANGKVSLNSETYTADITTRDLNVGHIMPSLGVGVVTADLTARGNGFNPTRPRAATDISLDVARADYGGHSYTGINGTVALHDGIYDVDLKSSDPDANLALLGSGSIEGNNYTADLHAAINYLDLKALGFSETENSGSAEVYIDGSANPAAWLYDMRLRVENFDWTMPGQEIHLPIGLEGTVLATADMVDVHFNTDGASLDFDSPNSLKTVVDKFTLAAATVQKQIEDKNLDITRLQKDLLDFNLHLNTSGRGVIAQLLHPQGIGLDTIYATISNVDSTLTGDIGVRKLLTSSMRLDTITLALNQRNSLLDYKAHLGNVKGNMPDFAKVDLSGYIGGNRLSAMLRQYNEEGKQGYKLGFTAAMLDSVATLHFTPLNATVAYLPWTFNLDNHVDYNFATRQVDANLMASSMESSILLKTQPADDGDNSLHLNIKNLHVQDFLSLAVTAPPLKASVDADMNLKYRGRTFTGDGRMDVKDFMYDRQRVDDFSLGFKANLDLDGNTDATASLIVADAEVLSVKGVIKADPNDPDPNDFYLTLNKLPLSMANAFIGKDVAQLSGTLNGNMEMDGKFSAPVLNGHINFEDAAVKIPMAASSIKFADTPIDVVDNVVDFNQFALTGQNANPLVIDGTVNAKDFSNVGIDLTANATNFQVLNNDRRSRADLYGKLFINLNAGVKGNLSRLDMNANLDVLGTSDVYYTVAAAEAALQQQQQSDVVKFVNFNDTASVAAADSIAPMMATRITAGVTISPGTRVTVNLSSNGTDKVQLSPSGTLNYFQNYMGDMRLSGQLNLGEGMARYSVQVIGEKSFTFRPESYIRWNGPIMNPVLSIQAYDDLKINVNDGGNARLVPFTITLDVGNTLESPKVTFDLSAEDMSIQNEIQGMTAEQRSNQAMNILLYGQYTGPNTKTQSGNLAESALYSFLTSKLNSWVANNIRGVDLTFGVNQYDQTRDGRNQQTTSYSYQVSKSLFNNRFKIVVGGNYSTDASADENFAQNILSDVSFEYILKQTNSLSMLVKLFRHSDYESVLEGEVTETGVGFVMKRRMENLKRFFRVRWGKRKPAPAPADSVAPDTTSTPSEK